MFNGLWRMGVIKLNHLKKKIGITTVMPLENNYVGVHGITAFFFPLIRKLKENGHKIYFFGKVVENKSKNIFCECLNLQPYNMNIYNDLETVNDMTQLKDLDDLLVYPRFPEVADEFDFQNKVITEATKNNIFIGVWDGDLKSQHIPEELRQHCTLLRPYSSQKFDKLFKDAHEFHYFTHQLYTKLEQREKIIDYLYIGNFYERFEELREKFEGLEGKIVIAGNHLKDEKKWNQSLQLKNVLYIKDVSHNMALPLLNISKETFYVIPKQYQEVGMITSRVYEAKMAECKIDVDTSNLNTLAKAYKKFEDIINEN